MRSKVGWKPLATGKGLGVALVAGHVDDVAALDDPRQGLGNGLVETPNRLGAAEDEDHPRVVRQVEPPARIGPVDRGRVTDRRSGYIPGLARTGEGPSRRP